MREAKDRRKIEGDYVDDLVASRKRQHVWVLFGV
jgi:hypothetical protein